MLKESHNKRLSVNNSDHEHTESANGDGFSLKNYVLGVIGFKRRKTTARTLDTPNTLLDAEIENKRLPVTAQQLHDYYVSLKNENSNLFEDLANVKTSTKGNAEFESFSINNKAAESTMIKDTDGNEQSNNANNNINEELRNEIITPALETDVSIETINNSLLPDPMERANLIQLKRMMEIERYKKLKMNYLRKHTRHLDRSGISKVAKDIKDRKRDFTNNGKSVSLKRKNKGGAFGISLLDTVGEIDDDSTDKKSEVTSISNTNISEKLKFNKNSDLDKLDVINKRKAVVLPMENDQSEVNSFNKPTDSAFEFTKDEKKLEIPKFTSAAEKKVIPVDEAKIEEVTPSSGFLFGAAPAKSEPKNDSPLPSQFSFSVPGAKAETITETKPKEAFSFNPTSQKAKKDSIVQPSTKFSFGQTKSVSEIMNNKVESTPATPVNGFTSLNFAAAKPESTLERPKVSLDVIADADGINGALKEKSPAHFGDGTKKETAKQGFSFGQPAAKGDNKPATGVFSFGQPTEKKEDKPAASGFSFGQPTEKKEDKPAASGFSFGQPTEKKEDKSAASGLSFGQPTEKKEDKPAASGFSFGQPTEKKEDKSAASGLSFGQPTEKKEDKPAASGFSFGQPTEKKEDKSAASGLSFGQPTEKKEDKPAASGFSFGQPTEKKEDKPAASGFSFGQPTEKKEDNPVSSGFNFNPSAAKKGPPAGGFSFSQAVEKKEEEPASNGFSFSQPVERNQDKPTANGFSFGQPTEKKEDKPATSGFSFSAAKKEPAAGGFSFSQSLATKNDKPAVSGFSSGETTGFGDNKKPSTAFSFNSSINATNPAANSAPPASGFAFENKGQANTGFGNNTASGFGQSLSNNAPGGFSQSLSNSAPGGFGQASSANNGFGFGSGPVSTADSGTATPTPSFSFGLANNQNNSDASNNKIFSFNSGSFPQPPQNTLNMNATNSTNANTGFGAGGQSFGMNSTSFGGLNNGPPNINFTGGQTGGMDPSMIFQQNQNVQSATPPPGRANRRIATYRSRRGGRQ